MDMEKELIAEKVKEIIAGIKHLKPEIIIDDDKLQDVLSMDSLDLVECALRIEEEFNIEIEDSILDEFRTVQDFINFVYSKRGGSDG